MATVVEIEKLSKTYRNGTTTVVFKDATYSLPSSKVIGLFAPSGYGKSTLIFLIAGLEKPDSGRVIVAGNDITRMNEKSLAIFRRKNIGIVFQFFNLIPTLTAIENVMLPMRLIGTKFQDAIKKAERLLKDVGLEEEHYNKFPSQLSGGQQQRVAIARALANNPKIILADEPTGNLDEKNAIRIFNLFKEINRKCGVSILIATHDVEHAREIVDLALTIRDHKIVEVD